MTTNIKYYLNFKFDIWGNTVNVASRMESSGRDGDIQVTGEVKKVLEPRGYKFTSRGTVDIKGKGRMETFWLLGPRPVRRVINSTDIDDRLIENHKHNFEQENSWPTG